MWWAFAIIWLFDAVLCLHPRSVLLHETPKLLSQVGKLHKCFVKPDTYELTDQCKEETGLTLEDIVDAEPLDKVLEQVSQIGHIKIIVIKTLSLPAIPCCVLYVPVWKFMVSKNTAPPIPPIGSGQVLNITVHFLGTWQLLVSSTTKLCIGSDRGERWRLGGNIETLKRELKEWILFMSEIVDRNLSLLSCQNEAFKWVGSGSDSI